MVGMYSCMLGLVALALAYELNSVGFLLRCTKVCANNNFLLYGIRFQAIIFYINMYVHIQLLP